MALKLSSINVTITVGDDRSIIPRPASVSRSFEEQMREVNELTAISAEDMHKLVDDAKALGNATKREPA